MALWVVEVYACLVFLFIELHCGLISYSMQEQNPHNAKKEECKETSDGLSQVPKKRQVILFARCSFYHYLFSTQISLA